MKTREKMPYEEVYFQRLKDDYPEDYEKLKSKIDSVFI
jgi:hypothetical protein